MSKNLLTISARIIFAASAAWIPSLRAVAQDASHLALQPHQTVVLCPEIAAPLDQCETFDAGASGTMLKVISIYRNAVGDHAYYRVRSPVGESGFVDGGNLVPSPTDPAVRLIDLGERLPTRCTTGAVEPQVGMTRQQIETNCWGKPEKIVTMSTLATLVEDYRYASGKALRLVNGVVSVKIEQR